MLITSIFCTILYLGDTSLDVEIADTEEKREKGLMEREELSEKSGMLFVYNTEKPLYFWMKNTKLPLSIAFFDKEKVLRQIEDMPPPYSEKTLRSKEPSRYALEVQRGWFERNNIRPGMKFTIRSEP